MAGRTPLQFSYRDTILQTTVLGDVRKQLRHSTCLPRREANSGGDAKQRGIKETPKLFPNVSFVDPNAASNL